MKNCDKKRYGTWKIFVAFFLVLLATHSCKHSGSKVSIRDANSSYLGGDAFALPNDPRALNQLLNEMNNITVQAAIPGRFTVQDLKATIRFMEQNWGVVKPIVVDLLNGRISASAFSGNRSTDSGPSSALRQEFKRNAG